MNFKMEHHERLVSKNDLAISAIDKHFFSKASYKFAVKFIKITNFFLIPLSVSSMRSRINLFFAINTNAKAHEMWKPRDMMLLTEPHSNSVPPLAIHGQLKC